MVLSPLFIFSFTYLKMQLTISRYFPNCNINNDISNFRTCINSEATKNLDFTMCENLFSNHDIESCKYSVKYDIGIKAVEQSNPALCENIAPWLGHEAVDSCKRAVENIIKDSNK